MPNHEEKLDLFNTLLQDSELTEEDVKKIDEQVKENVFKRIMAKKQ